MKRSMAIFLCLAVFMPSAARSLTITVDWDGSRDAVTIQEGIDMASDGDALRINGGTYLETDITLDGKDITLFYGDGIPTIKSPVEGTGTGLILRNVTSATWVYALNFESYDTAILIENGSPDINYCSITGCLTGLEVTGTGGDPDFSFNLIEGFVTAVDVTGGGTITIRNLTIAEGVTGIYAGAAVIDCSKSIVYRCETGIQCAGGAATLDCNDFWENTADYSGCPQGATDISLMPMFCYEAGGSPGPYYLHIDSPCWAANNACGVSMGAFTSVHGCVGVATEESTWGEIKRLHSR